MIIQVLGQQFSVCKVADYGEVDCCQPFVFTGSTDAEKSLVCPTECIPAATIERVDGWASRFGWSEALRLSLTVGLCGGFTTFSTFSKDSLALIDSGSYGLFALYAAGSVALGIASTALGLWLAK